MISCTTGTPGFRPFESSDTSACLAVFDMNCPAFFAPDEREDYAEFLAGAPTMYEVCVSDGRVLGAFGVTAGNSGDARVNWILLHPAAKGAGVGAAMMQRAIGHARNAGATRLDIAASHLSEPFFARFGARTVSRLTDGWGEGMHRHDMVLTLSAGQAGAAG